MLDRKECVVYAGKILVICLVFSVLLFGISACFFAWNAARKYQSTASVLPAAAIVLDAGHGGRDGGAVSADGVTEKELNLAVTKAMYDYVTLCGVEAVMTRTEDTLVCDENDSALKGKLKMTDLKNRRIIAESHPDAIFVSIHMNKFSIEKYNGLQVYFSKNNEESAALAEGVQSHVQSTLQPENTRKVKAAGSNIFLLDRLEMPAILIECGFLSNRAEAERLADKTYQMQLAVVIADCLLAN